MIWLLYLAGAAVGLFAFFLLWGFLHLRHSARRALEEIQTIELADVEPLTQERVAVFQEKFGVQLNLDNCEDLAEKLDEAFLDRARLKDAFAKDHLFWYFVKPVGACLGELLRRHAKHQWIKKAGEAPSMEVRLNDGRSEAYPFDKVIKQVHYTTMSTYCDEVRQHYEKVWADRATIRRWATGPIHELPLGFQIAEFEPKPDAHTWAYGTCCMSQPDDDEALELHLFAPFQDESHVELLTIVSHYHRTGARLGLGHTVHFGRPWLPNSTCSFGLISLPFLDGPILENHRSSAFGNHVRFLWLIPITERERDCKIQYGVETLEAAFEKAVVNYVDPTRDSVI